MQDRIKSSVSQFRLPYQEEPAIILISERCETCMRCHHTIVQEIHQQWQPEGAYNTDLMHLKGQLAMAIGLDCDMLRSDMMPGWCIREKSILVVREPSVASHFRATGEYRSSTTTSHRNSSKALRIQCSVALLLPIFVLSREYASQCKLKRRLNTEQIHRYRNRSEGNHQMMLYRTHRRICRKGIHCRSYRAA